MGLCECEWKCPGRPEEALKSPGAGVTDTCELPDMGAMNGTSGRVVHDLNK